MKIFSNQTRGTISRAAFIISLLLMINPSYAQTGCASPDNSGADATKCAPSDITNVKNVLEKSSKNPEGKDLADSSLANLPQKGTQFGAFAYDGKNNRLGSSHNQVSQDQANNLALKDCTLAGGASCNIITTFANQCAAFSWGKREKGGAMFVNLSPDLETAKKDAIGNCELKSTNCQIVKSTCSLP